MSSEAKISNDDLATYQDLQSRIEVVLVVGDGTWINLCHAIFEMLEEAEENERPALIEFVAENLGWVESSEELKVPIAIQPDQEKELRDRYGKVVNDLLALILRENLPESEFYKKIWETAQNPIFADKASKVFCFYYIMIDRRIPYFQIGSGRKMTEENWKAAANRLVKEARKLRFLLATDFDQKSQEASLILEEIEKLDNEEDKVWLFAQALGELRRQEERKYASLRESLAQGGV